MKYQLLPLDPELDPIDFDTQSILDLARLGPYDKDAGVVYFDGVACLEPRPDKTTMGHVRRLEAELLAANQQYQFLLSQHKVEIDSARATMHKYIDLLAACGQLLAYRRRAGAINFQLEKMDDYLREIQRLYSLETLPEPAAAKGTES